MSLRFWFYAALFAAGFAIAWTAQGWRYGQQIAEAENDAWSQRIEAMQAKVATDRLTQQRQQDAAQIAALRGRERQTETKTITREVIRYVQNPDAGQCDLDTDWLRIHDAAATGDSRYLPGADSDPTPPDAATTRTSDADALVTITENYQTCGDIRQQLIDLQQLLKSDDMHSAN